MSNSADPTVHPAAHVTATGAAWLASASCFPRSVHALWALRPAAPSVLPCGTAFDVVTATPVQGRRLLDRLWSDGPGSGPVAVHQGRTLFFCAPGTADRLPALLNWEEWGSQGEGRARHSASPLLCHGAGDTVTVPPLHPDTRSPAASRWLVAPDVRHPWLPGPEVLLWAYARRPRTTRPSRAPRISRTPCSRGAGRPRRTSRAGHGGTGGEKGAGEGGGISIFTPPDGDAKVYDVSRRR